MVIRTEFRQESAGSRIFTVAAGVVAPILLFGFAALAWLNSGSADAAVLPAAFGAAFLVAVLGQSVRQTLRLGRQHICLETLWTRRAIALTNVERVAVAKDRPLVAVASESGTLIVAGEGFSEADKSRLVAMLRARLPPEVPFEESDRIPFGWASDSEDEVQQHQERHYGLGLWIIIGLGFVVVFSVLGLTTFILWAESPVLGAPMLLIVASLALMLATAATGKRTYMMNGVLLLGIATFLVASYSVLAEVIGLPSGVSIDFPFNMALVIAGLTVLFFYASDRRVRKGRSVQVNPEESRDATYLRTATGILFAVSVGGIAVFAVIQGSSDFPAGVRWGYAAVAFTALIFFFHAIEKAVKQMPHTPFPAAFVRAERGLAVVGSIGIPIGAWQFFALGSPGPAIWCVSGGLFLVVWLFRALPRARAVVTVFSLYGLAVGTAAAWYTQQVWGVSRSLSLTIGGFLAIVLIASGAQAAWIRLGYEP